MTFLRLQPQKQLSELLLKRHGKVMSVKLENLREIKQLPPKLKLVCDNGKLKKENNKN